MPPRWHATFLRSNSNSSGDSESAVLSIDDEIEYLSKDFTNLRTRRKFGHPSLRNRDFYCRELGDAAANTNLQNTLRRTFKPWRSWTGASKDILSVAWGFEGYFAAGAGTNHADSSDLPYNKANNLLFGRVHGYSSQLGSLTGHSLRRAADQSWNADPDLHMTVSHVTFAEHHPLLYSSGYDKTVRIWDLPSDNSSSPHCRAILQHDCGVDILGLRRTQSAADKQILATAQRSAELPIRIYDASRDVHEQDRHIINLVSARSPQYRLHPSAIEWGPSARTRNWLLAGFTEFSDSQENKSDREGDVCLWNMERHNEPVQLNGATDTVFAVAWSPKQFVIATASAARNPALMANRNETRSVIKTWSPGEFASRIFELECPALDINDVQFHPSDGNIITASCTDGRIYMWDVRKASEIALVLEHAIPIETYLEPFEVHDVGIRFTSWGHDGRYLYTGGSDGRIACWNALVSPSDALAQEVVQLDSGVMAASFSPDGSKLLVGTVKGSVEILSIGATQGQEDAGSEISATERFGDFETTTITAPYGSEEVLEGQEAAKALILSGQLVYHPKYGVGQGPNYAGPWNLDSHVNGEANSPLLPEVAAQQFDKGIRRTGRQDGGVTAVISIRAHRDAAAIAYERNALKDEAEISQEMRAAALLDEILEEENSDAEIGNWIGDEVEETYEDLVRYARVTDLSDRKRELEGGTLPERKKSREITHSASKSRMTLQNLDPTKRNGTQELHARPALPVGVNSGTGTPVARAMVAWNDEQRRILWRDSSQHRLESLHSKPAASHTASRPGAMEKQHLPLSTYTSNEIRSTSASFPQQSLQSQTKVLSPNNRPTTADATNRQSVPPVAQDGEATKVPSTPRKGQTSAKATGTPQGSPLNLTPRSQGRNGFIIPPRIG